MNPTKTSIYVLCGVADYRPPEIWEKVAANSDLLQESWESGKLESLYTESLLWTGFEKLAAEAIADGVDLSEVRAINVAGTYPRELAQLADDFLWRLSKSPRRNLFKKLPKIRFTPSHAASSSGMVPFNDAIADILVRGDETSIVVTAGNTKGTNRHRPRISPDETTEIFASLISPFDRKHTGANMLKLGAVAVGRACQSDANLLEALEKFAYDQRVFTHQLAMRNLSTAHVATHPDRIKDQTIFYPLKLRSVAPQSLGYAGFILSNKAPDTERAVRVVGLGSGVDASSIRDRDSHLSRAMTTSVTAALHQANIVNPADLKIIELHNPFTGVSLAELEVILKFIG